MNDAPTPSSPARPSPAHGGENTSDITEAAQDAPTVAGPEPDSDVSQRLQQARKAGLIKKLQFTTHLLKNLDALVYAELSALYYMECSFFRFSIRSFAQFTFLTPKSDSFPIIMQAHRSHVVSIFLPNIICILLHIFTSLPEATEESRGYLHGGVIVDFIGQKAPTSRLPLLFLDMAVLALQCLMLAVHSERERLRSVVRPFRLRVNPTTEAATATGGNDAAATERSTTQDHDAEERGVLRDAPEEVDESDEIEMRDLDRGQGGRDGGRNEERQRLISGVRAPQRGKSQLSDILSSGNAILGEFHILHTIRTATTDYEGAAAHSIQTLGYTAALAALAAQRRAQ